MESGRAENPAFDRASFETLAEVDFYSYRPPDLTHKGQSSG